MAMVLLSIPLFCSHPRRIYLRRYWPLVSFHGMMRCVSSVDLPLWVGCERHKLFCDPAGSLCARICWGAEKAKFFRATWLRGSCIFDFLGLCGGCVPCLQTRLTSGKHKVGMACAHA